METDGDAEARDTEPPAEEATTILAPALLWKPERIAADLKVSRQLMEKLDKEKGIVSNPLLAADKLEEPSAGESLHCT